ARVPVDDTIAFVCGPPVMFRFVIKDLKALGFQDKNIVSTLERYMKCGVGKCGHCCIGVAYVCVDGPVFTYEQIQHCFRGRVCLMGVGNMDYGDDSFGLRLAEKLAGAGVPEVITAGTTPE